MADEHSPLAHHFDDLEQQKDSLTLGMWVFLATEVMIFGGLFTAYAVYRWSYPVAFAEASHHMLVWLAVLNTVILLTSSLTMALAVYGAQTGKRGMLVGFLGLTVLLGTAFLVIKGYEYTVEYHEGLIPLPGMFTDEGWKGWKEMDITIYEPAGVRFVMQDDGTKGPQIYDATPTMVELSDEARRQIYIGQVKLFYVLYFVMTGLHAVHMIIGLGILLVLMVMAWRGAFTPEYHPQVELTGLYWHFVDLVWIFLLPLLYLIGLH